MVRVALTVTCNVSGDNIIIRSCPSSRPIFYLINMLTSPLCQNITGPCIGLTRQAASILLYRPPTYTLTISIFTTS